MRKGSVQHAFVTVEAVQQEVLCLASAQRHQWAYRAAIEVQSINFALKSEREQEAILAAYAAFLNGLSFPVQIFVQVRPLALQPYLGHVRRERERARATEANAEATALWDRLTEEYLGFVAGLAAERTMLDRRFFVIIPADTGAAGRSTDPLGAFLTTAPLPFLRRKQDQAQHHAFTLARQQLALRADLVIGELGRMGLVATRLGNADLLDLCYHALAPGRAATHALDASVIAAVGLPHHAVPVTPHADAVVDLRQQQERALDALFGSAPSVQEA